MIFKIFSSRGKVEFGDQRRESRSATEKEIIWETIFNTMILKQYKIWGRTVMCAHTLWVVDVILENFFGLGCFIQRIFLSYGI